MKCLIYFGMSSMKEGTSAQLSVRGELHGGARVTTLVTLRKCTLGNKREIKTLKFVLASTKGFKGGLAWIKPSKKDMAVTFSDSKSMDGGLSIDQVYKPGLQTRSIDHGIVYRPGLWILEPSIQTTTGLTPSATTLLWPCPVPDIGCTNKYPFGFGPGRNTVGGLYTRAIDQ